MKQKRVFRDVLLLLFVMVLALIFAFWPSASKANEVCQRIKETERLKRVQPSLLQVDGKLVGLRPVIDVSGKRCGTELRIKTETKTIPVHIGPSWSQGTEFSSFGIGDKLMILGVKFPLKSEKGFFARKIKKR